MALLFADGFDHYETTDALKKWTSAANITFTVGGSSNFAVNPAWARPPGGQGALLGSGNTQLNKTIPGDPLATVVCGFNAQLYTAVVSAQFFRLMDTGAEQLSLRTDATGHLVLSRSGTALATSTNVLVAGVWYHFEIKATIGDSAAAYEVRVNGTATGWISGTGDTKQTTNASVNGIQLCSVGTAMLFDDLYVLDTTGSVAADFIGQSKIITVYPNGAGQYADWIGNYASNFANVNELVGDGDGTFNQASTAGNKDSFEFDDVPTGTVHAIQSVLQARQDAGASRTVRHLMRRASTDYFSTSFALAGSHFFLLAPRTLDPSTSAQFTVANLNASQHGYELET